MSRPSSRRSRRPGEPPFTAGGHFADGILGPTGAARASNLRVHGDRRLERTANPEADHELNPNMPTSPEAAQPRRRRGARLVAVVAGAILAVGALATDAASQEGPAPGESSSLATPESRRAADRGLAWLVRNQQEDGSWLCDIGFKLNDQYKVLHESLPHVGVTALAGTAFLAAGSVPGRGPYAKEVEKCLDFILASQDATGFLAKHDTRMYSHAFATMFLAEVYGTTRDRRIRDALQRAVEFTYKAQNQEGGWRYVPNAEDSDMSITVCQVVALRAAKNKGIAVPKESIDAAVDYVLKSSVTREDWHRNFEPGAFLYQYKSKNEQAAAMTRTSFALTAAGLTTLYGAGIYNDADIQDFCKSRRLRLQEIPRFRNMLGYVQRHYDDVARRQYRDHYFYYYGNYYAVQAMYIAGDPWWTEFYVRLRDDVVRRQQPDGSWPSNVGAAYSTAVSSIILQVPNSYLPIFQR